jgi:hypothetical protein
VNAFKILLSSPLVDPAFNGNQALLEAIKSTNVKIITMLLQHPHVDPGINRNEALHVAICARDNRILEVLLQSEKVNPGDRDGVFLPLILERLPVKLLGLLLNHPRCHPSVNNNFALRVAIRRKDISSVKGILCKVRKRKVDPNIPIYEASTPLMEAVKSGYWEIVAHLINFSRYSPTVGDLERALSLAKQMKSDKMVTVLAGFKECDAHRISRRSDETWSFSVDPARILVWLRAFIKDKHARDGTNVAADMARDILDGRSVANAYSLTFRDQNGFEPLKLAYEDFMISRPEMPEADRNDMFVRIMTTDFVPEFLVFESQPAPLSAYGFWQSQVLSFTTNTSWQASATILARNVQVPTVANRRDTMPSPARPLEYETSLSLNDRGGWQEVWQENPAVSSSAWQSEDSAPACKRRRTEGPDQEGEKEEAGGKEPEDRPSTDWINGDIFDSEDCPPPADWGILDTFDFDLQW